MGSETRRNVDFLTLDANFDSGPHRLSEGWWNPKGPQEKRFTLEK